MLCCLWFRGLNISWIVNLFSITCAVTTADLLQKKLSLSPFASHTKRGPTSRQCKGRKRSCDRLAGESPKDQVWAGAATGAPEPDVFLGLELPSHEALPLDYTCSPVLIPDWAESTSLSHPSRPQRSELLPAWGHVLAPPPAPYPFVQGNLHVHSERARLSIDHGCSQLQEER